MALNTNPFVEGIDPTATFGGYASVLLQLIREAQPSSTYGMILFDTTAPDVTGANAWRKRCIWIDLTVPGTPVVYIYKEGGSPGWENVLKVIPPDTIATAMIQNAAVTLAKLSTSGGAANQLIRVNATATAFEFVSLSNLVVNGSINIGALSTSGIPAGQFRLAGTYGPNVASWYTAQNIIDNLTNAAIGTDLIGPAPAATSRSQFLTTRLADTFSTWRYFDPSVDIAAGSINGDRLINNTFALSKIIPHTSNAILMTSGGVVDWITPLNVQGSTTQFVTDTTAVGAVPTTAGGSTTLSHTLAAMPLMYRVTLYCQTPDGGYVQGDELEASSVQLSGGDYANAFAFYITSAAVIVRRNFANQIYIPEKAGTAQHAINDARWRLRLYAMTVA